MVERPLDSSNIALWLEDWAKLAALFQECMARFDVAAAVNTADEAARQRVTQYRETVWPIMHRLDQRLSERQQSHADLLPPIIREVEARWSQANRLNQSQTAIDLLNREAELFGQYAEIMGQQTILWNGEVLSARRLNAIIDHADRSQRERAWRAMRTREWQDREAVGRIWSELLDVRSKLAEVNGFDDYLAYRWTELGRTDYTPEDSHTLHAFILRYWAPLYATRMNSQRIALQVEALRPWDPDSPPEQNPLHPFDSTSELLEKTLNMFRRMDAEFAAFVERLRDLGFIDLSERTNTNSSGGFSRVIGRNGNFIFMNISRTSGDVVGLAHEIGHAVSNYASARLPYLQLWGFPADFNETPSSAMEMLTQPYWDEFYSPDDLQRELRQYFQGVINAGLFETALDAFQHWIYQNSEAAHYLDACDDQWHRLMDRYLPGRDWTGIEQLHGMGWQTMSLIFYMPLHAMEYAYGRMAGLKLLMLPQDEALARYKAAIGLGNSVSTRGLFAALGVSFPFAEDDVRTAAQSLSAYM